MTDYKKLKLTATSSPHIRAGEDTRSIMLDVIIALCPALVWAVIEFGFRSLTVTCFSIIGCIFWEWLYRKLMKKPQSIADLSAVVTGILMPSSAPSPWATGRSSSAISSPSWWSSSSSAASARTS
jgi:electron transport complex protein RnfD